MASCPEDACGCSTNSKWNFDRLKVDERLLGSPQWLAAVQSRLGDQYWTED